MLLIEGSLETVRDFVHIVGIPALFGAIIWLIRTYDAGTRKLNEIHVKASEAATVATEVKSTVDVMQGNHLAHIQKGIDNLGIQGDRQIELLAVIADRTPRL